MARKNLYPGVNPHLNSALQSTGGDWHSFHNSCIERMADVLEQVLPAGYYPFTEEGLHLKRIDPETGDDPLMSVVVYALEKAGRGEPVTRIELLSPVNKPGGGHYNPYMVNRNLTLQSRLRLVEIDLLHETRPIISRIPSYPAGDAESFPYSILISDPRPSIYEGVTQIYGFDVKDELPTVNIPLEGEDVATVDFGEIYNLTFQQRYAYHTVLTDYTKQSERFETYSDEDQQYILQRMAEIADSNAL